MNDSLYIAATGMQAQQTSIETIAHNLANVNTPTFKAGRINFQELMLSEQAGTPNAASANPATLGVGVAVDSVGKDFSTGQLTQTNSPLDLAINGAGFLEVTLPDGSHAYTRGGTLQVTKDAYLATAGGNLLKPAIHVPQDIASLLIDSTGKVWARTSSQQQATEIGQIELANFANPAALRSVGNGSYVSTDASGEATYSKPGTGNVGTLAQGSLESSNVSLVNEMVNLMVAQRAYELSSKVIQASDEIMSLTNNLRR